MVGSAGSNLFHKVKLNYFSLSTDFLFSKSGSATETAVAKCWVVNPGEKWSQMARGFYSEQVFKRNNSAWKTGVI